MKLLTTNFLTCAVKACKSSPKSFPLHFRDATLERTEIDFNPVFIRNILPRVHWDALKGTAAELGLSAMVPEVNPSEDTLNGGSDQQEQEAAEEEDMNIDEHEQTKKSRPTENMDDDDDETILKNLHTLLLETGVVEGKLVCGNCGFEYPIKEGVGNFLLPPHLV